MKSSSSKNCQNRAIFFKPQIPNKKTPVPMAGFIPKMSVSCVAAKCGENPIGYFP